MSEVKPKESDSSVGRYTVVRCLDWPVVGIGYRESDLVAVVSANRVVAVSQQARSQGVDIGLGRREAQRRIPKLKLLAPDVACESRRFEPVLNALEAITPEVEVIRPGLCSFLARGPSRYFGGEEPMARMVLETVKEVLKGSTSVRIGVADGHFCALIASALPFARTEVNTSKPGLLALDRLPESRRDKATKVEGVTIVAKGESRRFMAPKPIETLSPGFAEIVACPTKAQLADLDGLIDVMKRLGLENLGGLAAISSADVLGRFGPLGARVHRWVRGRDDKPWVPQGKFPEMRSSVEIEPPVQLVDQAGFIAKSLAQEFMATLAHRGLGCTRIGIVAETDHGERQTRVWRSGQVFTATAIVERVRWQLDGWFNGPRGGRPSSGLTLLVFEAEELALASGSQTSLWGVDTSMGERAARAVARVQALAGPDSVTVPELRGGRSSGESVVAIAAELVDLVERSAAVERRQVGESVASATAGIESLDEPLSESHIRQGKQVLPMRYRDVWMGRLPSPAPTRLHRPRLLAQLIDDKGATVVVSARGILKRDPSWLTIEGFKPVEVLAWSGPWLIDERWWQADGRRRQVRMQLVLADGRALLMVCRSGNWSVDATYD